MLSEIERLPEEKEMLTLKCPKHPRYTGKESPRASCLQCLFIYHARRDAELNHVQTERK